MVGLTPGSGVAASLQLSQDPPQDRGCRAAVASYAAAERAAKPSERAANRS